MLHAFKAAGWPLALPVLSTALPSSSYVLHEIRQSTERGVWKHWLIASGIAADTVIHYENKEWVAVKLPIREIERLFQEMYHEHEHSDVLKLGCDEYHVPQMLSERIDYIIPGQKFSPHV
ncbi:hypothetical protein GQ53DRAFT_760174 [Thozetella sp. PMI_491]|nr:hypothetical protein GQ53DRAFT_760174 [Thozetella sp. PMI_491]